MLASEGHLGDSRDQRHISNQNHQQLQAHNMRHYNNDDDFQHKKLYINHKTRRKSCKVSRLLTQSLAILKPKRQLKGVGLWHISRGLGLFRCNFISNKANYQLSSHSKQSQRLELVRKRQISFEELRLSLCNYETLLYYSERVGPLAHRYDISKSSSSSSNSISNSPCELRSFRNAHAPTDGATKDLKLRLALRKRYLRRKRKRKFTTRRRAVNGQPELQHISLEPCKAKATNAACLEYKEADDCLSGNLASCPWQRGDTTLTHSSQGEHSFKMFDGKPGKEASGLRCRSTSAPTNSYGGHHMQRSNCSHNTVIRKCNNTISNTMALMILLRALILSVAHLSFATLATLSVSAATALSHAAQGVVNAVIVVAATLPIIQRRKQQQQQLQHKPQPAQPYLPRASYLLQQRQQQRTQPPSAPSPPTSQYHHFLQLPALQQPTYRQTPTPTQLEHLPPTTTPPPSPTNEQLQSQSQSNDSTTTWQQQQQQEQQTHASVSLIASSSGISSSDSDRGSSSRQLLPPQRCPRRELPLTTKGLNKYSWIFLLIYLNLSAKVCLAGYNEKRLLHDLLDTYNTLERPVLNESDPLQLSFGLTLMQIIDVDEKNQLLVTNVWLKLEWNDMNLRWNTSDYGGIKDLRIPPHRIWKPDVLMYNSADEGFDGTYQTNVVVRNNGSCLYVPPGIFKSTCKIDITWFPFDDQRCEMKFGSWTYDGFQLDLQLQDETGGDISSYVLNGEWELLGVPGKRNEIYYNCCPEPYIDITFAIIIRRRTLYYFFNLIIPCVLIASMALLGFTLPPDSGEKLSLGVTILLSLTVFLNMVAETMPATSDAVPLLGTYFNCIMFMVASSVVSTILVLNYHHRNADTHEMSEWIRVVFLCWLPWILRMHRPGRPIIMDFTSTPCSDTSSERKHQILSDVELKERSSKSLLANVLDIDDDFRNVRPMTPGGTLPHNPAFYRTVYGYLHNLQGDDGSIGPIGSTRMPDAVTHHTCIKTQTEYELSLILKEIRFITDQYKKWKMYCIKLFIWHFE